MATDGGASNAQSTSITVTVDILDINDNDPVFTNLPRTISVPENQPAGTVFTVKVCDVECIDPCDFNSFGNEFELIKSLTLKPPLVHLNW